MRAVSKKLVVDEKTLAPEMELVLRIPMEPLQDARAMDPNFYENIGKKFIEALEQS
jgi:hypothetical protein